MATSTDVTIKQRPKRPVNKFKIIHTKYSDACSKIGKRKNYETKMKVPFKSRSKQSWQRWHFGIAKIEKKIRYHDQSLQVSVKAPCHM